MGTTRQQDGSGADGSVTDGFQGAVPPPKRMRDLDFMLGALTVEVSTGTRIVGTITPTFGGHYYQFDLDAERTNGEKLSGRWILAWNPADEVFTTYYFDNAGMQGVSTSPGWQDGTMTFRGTYVVGSARLPIESVFERVSEDHFVIRESILKDGEWKELDVQQCYRTVLPGPS